MRGIGNPIKKPEKNNKNLDNSKDKKNTCSQDQNKKSKAFVNLNTKIKSQISISPLTTNLNNLIITNQNYSNTCNAKFIINSNKHSDINTQKSGKKSLTNLSQNNLDLNSNCDDKSVEKKHLNDCDRRNNNDKSKESINRNLNGVVYLETNNSDIKDFENISSENNKEIKNTSIKINEDPFTNSKTNFKKLNLFLENIYDYQETRSQDQNGLNAQKNMEQINVRESYRGMKNKLLLDDIKNLNASKDFEENIYQGKLTDNNTGLKVMDNPFAVDPKYKVEEESNKPLEVLEIEQNEIKLKALNQNAKIEPKILFTPSKANIKPTSNSKKSVSKKHLKIAINKVNCNNKFTQKHQNITEKDIHFSSKTPNERENISNNILLTSNSNLSPIVSNSININSFNRNNKKGNQNQVESNKHIVNSNLNKCNMINLNNQFLKRNNQQNRLGENKDETLNINSYSNNISPNNFLNNLSNQNKNNGNFSITNSTTSNILFNNHLNNQVCHTVENEKFNKEEIIGVNYCNTNPNENDKINYVKLNNNSNFNFTKIKDNEVDKLFLKNNSLNKILQNIKGNNLPYIINNNQSTTNNIYNINGTNSNILSTNHTDNNILINSNSYFPNNFSNKTNKEINNLENDHKKNIIISKDFDERPNDKNSINILPKNNNFLGNSGNEIQDLYNKSTHLEAIEKNMEMEIPKVKNRPELNINVKENRIINKKIIYNTEDTNNKYVKVNKSNKDLNLFVQCNDKKEQNEKIVSIIRENQNRYSSNFEKGKLKKNSLSNTYANVNNIQNKNSVAKDTKISKEVISSVAPKNNLKEKNINVKNINNLMNDNQLKNFNYVSLGYLDNPLIHSGVVITKEKSKNKQYDLENQKTYSEEGLEIKDDNDAKFDNGSASKNKNEKVNFQNFTFKKNFNNKPVKNFEVEQSNNRVVMDNYINSNFNAYNKNSNNQINPVTKSLNNISNKNQLINSYTKIVKEFTEKTNGSKLKNKMAQNINLCSLSKKNSGVNVSESRVPNNFIKKDVCRIFNSDDFYERNKIKKFQMQEANNALNNIKLNSLYSKNLSQKINSKNIQINLYNYNNDLDTDKLYDLDFNSNLKDKEKTIIIDDIDELKDEGEKFNDDIKYDLPVKNTKLTETEEINRLNSQMIDGKINSGINNDFKSDILHSILNFKGFFKNNDKNQFENIYQSKECVKQLNQLNLKLEELKIPQINIAHKNEKINKYEDEDFVKIKESPFKNILDLNIKYKGDQKNKNNELDKKTNDFCNYKKSDTDREYYYFTNETSNSNKENKNTDFIFKSGGVNSKMQDNNAIYPKTFYNEEHLHKETYLKKQEIRTNTQDVNKGMINANELINNGQDKTEKNNIINEIHFNSDVRMKRYEILLDFINSNMKEIEKMVSGETQNDSKKLETVKKHENHINNEYYQNLNDYRQKMNFSKYDEFSEAKNNYCTSNLNSLKKIEETNSNKVSSLHSRINFNSRLSNNEFNIDNSEVKAINNFGETKKTSLNLMESSITNQLREQVNNLSLLLSNHIKENRNNNNDHANNNCTNEAGKNNNNHNLTNEFESINFYKMKKDPGSSLLISSIYSDFNPDIIDESFNNNILNLINNPYQHSKILQNGLFTNNNDNKTNKITNNNIVSKNSESKRETNKSIENINTNSIQTQIINNIITMNNNFNKSKKNLNTVEDPKNQINSIKEKNTIQPTNSKTAFTNTNVVDNRKVNNDAKSKNYLDKNLLTLITNNNTNKILTQNISYSNNAISKINNLEKGGGIMKAKNEENPNLQKIESHIAGNNDINSKCASQIRKNSKINEKYFNTIEGNYKDEMLNNYGLEKKDSTEMMVEKETNINSIKNIDNKYNNISALNNKNNKKNFTGADSKNVLNTIQYNYNSNQIIAKNDDNNQLIRNDIIFAKNIKQQMSPSNDSDRTVVQFYDKNFNLQNNLNKLDIERINNNKVLKLNKFPNENEDFNPNIKPSVLENYQTNSNKIKNLNGNDVNSINGTTNGYIHKENEKESANKIDKTNKDILDENNKDKPKCLIF